MKWSVVKKIGLLLGVMLLTFACCGCSNKKQSDAGGDHTKDSETVIQSQEAENAVSDSKEFESEGVSAKDIHEGYESVSYLKPLNDFC